MFNDINYAYSNLEEIVFIKVLVLFNGFNNDRNIIDNKKVYIDFIKNEIIEKEPKKRITFNVISIEFINKKKPKIKNLYSEKIY